MARHGHLRGERLTTFLFSLFPFFFPCLSFQVSSQMKRSGPPRRLALSQFRHPVSHRGPTSERCRTIKHPLSRPFIGQAGMYIVASVRTIAFILLAPASPARYSRMFNTFQVVSFSCFLLSLRSLQRETCKRWARARALASAGTQQCPTQNVFLLFIGWRKRPTSIELSKLCRHDVVLRDPTNMMILHSGSQNVVYNTLPDHSLL